MTDKISKPESAAIAISEKKGCSKVCRYFKKGFCGYGEKCLYRHIKPKIRPCLGIDNPSDVKKCRFYKKSSCKFASKCWYNHIRPNGKPYPKPEPLNKFIVVGPSGNEPEKTKDTLTSSDGTPDVDSTASAAIPTQKTAIRRSFRRPRNLHIVPKNCFYYEEKGTCYYEDKCWYSHSESCVQVGSADVSFHELEPEQELDPDHSKMCYNFIFDVCEFGDNCAYVHGDLCQFCNLAFLHPFDEQQRKDHLEACENFFLEDMEISFAFMRSKDKICAICLDNVWELDKLYTKWKFGINSECNHVFCLDCIRQWRDVKRNDGQPRLCPACRVESNFVVPSTYWFKNKEEKDQLLKDYKAAVNQRPCKFYEKGKCKNEDKCQFLHLEFTNPLVERQDEGLWGHFDPNIGLPSGEQEGPRNLAEGMEDDGRSQWEVRWQSDQDSNIWGDLSPEEQTNEYIASQSGEQASARNSAEDSLGQFDVGHERNSETQLGRNSDTRDDASPESQSNEDLVLRLAEQISANLLETMEHQFVDNLSQVDVFDDQRDLESQVLEQDPGASFDES